ncbi:MAG: FecR domain-containing protein [Opitutaceae bacterium]
MNSRLSTEHIDELAARWTSRLDGGELSPADRLALDAWLGEDPAHRVAFESYQRICDETAAALPALAQISAVARPEPLPEVDLGLRWPRWIAAATGLAAVFAVCAVWLVPFVRDTQRITTVAAQRSTLSLADGTRTELNAQTALITDFRGGRRFVRLEKGEAFFTVAKDEAHPFVVETPGGTVRVTGTQFNLRLASDGRPEVTLVEGAVEIQNGLALLQIKPGQQLSRAGELRTLAPREIDRVTAWREGRIVLNGLTLAEAAERFATFHGKSIEVAPALSDREMGGSYLLDDLPGFLDALSSQPLGLRVIRRDSDSIVITWR